MLVDPKLLTGLALAAALCGCVAPEEPSPAPRAASATKPAPSPNQANFEAAPTPNRQVRGPNSGIIQVDQSGKPRS